MFKRKDHEFLKAMETPELLGKRIAATSRSRLGAAIFALIWSLLFFEQLFSWLSFSSNRPDRPVSLPYGLPLCLFYALFFIVITAAANAELRSLFIFRKLRRDDVEL